MLTNYKHQPNFNLISGIPLEKQGVRQNLALTYNTKAMTLEDVYNKVVELCPFKSNKNNFREDLDIALTKYLSILSELDYNVPDSWNKVIDHASSLKESICEIVKLLLQGKSHLAYEDLGTILLKEKLNAQKESAGHSYYRMRIIDEPRTELSSKDLFHVPLNMRSKIQTQRYSIPGYPCLYIGNSIYACWEEMGRPAMHNSWFARLENQKSIMLLDLRIPLKDKFLKTPLYYARLFPFIITCMMPIKDYKAVFKPEYLFPQLILEWVISSRNYDGIYYTSTHKDEEFAYPVDKSYNVVIPVKNPLQVAGFCPNLKKTFYISEPVNYEIENLKRPFPDNSGYYSIDPGNIPNEMLWALDGEIDKSTYSENDLKIVGNYVCSDFGKLEKALLNRPVDVVG